MLSFLLRVFVGVLFFTLPGFAQEPSATQCLLWGPAYQLAADTVEWSMSVGSGQSCVRGLRSAFVTLDTIKLVTPPKSGQVVLEGPAFVYKVDPDFHGEDSFAVLVSGKQNRVAGSSTIRVLVSVK